MAGIYIHIPFCKHACTYCNFHFSTSLAQKSAFITALLHEIELTPATVVSIETIYFGGGTPSLLSIDELAAVLNAIHQKFSVLANAEITLEANPDDINPAALLQWKQAGINRFSIGIQSFDEAELKWMNRAHNAQEALHCIDEVQHAGFTNFSADIIYGSPLLTDEQLAANLQKLIDKNVPHISCYALTVEPKTNLAVQIKKGVSENTNTEKQAKQYMQVMYTLAAAGYEHYEISNFAKPGMHSRHNSSYWQAKPYYGFGPSAHSFDGDRKRKWNIANNALYIKALQENKLPFEEEILTDAQCLNEYMMIALRTSAGINLYEAAQKFGEENATVIRHQFEKAKIFFGTDKFLVENNNIKLTNEGRLFADGIAGEMFV